MTLLGIIDIVVQSCDFIDNYNLFLYELFMVNENVYGYSINIEKHKSVEQ